MDYQKKPIGGSVEILAAAGYLSFPVRCGAGGILKAGTPLTADGTAALDGSGAVGILLNDVDPTVNPNGSMVVSGVIDYAKAKANAGITATAEQLHSAIPGICFRTNIGTNEEEDDEMIVHFTITEDDEGVVHAEALEDFSDVLAAVQAEKTVIAKAQLPGDTMTSYGQLNFVYDDGNNIVLQFFAYLDTAGEWETPKPSIILINFTANACDVEEMALTPAE